MLDLFVEDITGMTKDELSTAQFAGLEQLEYPELHEESIPELTFFRAVYKMMMACGVHDFSVYDLINPDGKRFRKQLSALINFTRFRNERMGAFSELNAETRNLTDLKQEAEEKHATLKDKLQVLRSQRVSEEPAMRKVKSECVALEEEIGQLNKEQAVLRNHTSDLKEQCNVLRDEISSKQYAILDAQQEAERLAGLVVNSPARVKQEIRSISHSLENVKEEVNQLERKERLKATYRDSLLRAEKDIRVVNAQMEDIEEVMQSCSAAKTDVREKRRTIESCRSMGEDAIKQKERLQRLLTQKQESLRECKENVALKLKATEEAIKGALAELEEAKANKTSTQVQVKRMDAHLKEQETMRKTDEEFHQKQLRDLIKMFGNVSHCVRSYNSELESALATAQG